MISVELDVEHKTNDPIQIRITTLRPGFPKCKYAFVNTPNQKPVQHRLSGCVNMPALCYLPIRTCMQIEALNLHNSNEYLASST